MVDENYRMFVTDFHYFMYMAEINLLGTPVYLTLDLISETVRYKVRLPFCGLIYFLCLQKPHDLLDY